MARTPSTASPETITARKIWDLEDTRAADGGLPEATDLRGEIHPDLIRYKGYWYCGLKEAPLKRMRLIRSADGETWESVKVFSWSGGCAVGDCKFSVTADGALMISTWAKDPRPKPGATGRGPTWTCSVTWLSDDGVNWGRVHACPSGFDGVVRYTTTWFRGVGYNICAHTGHLYRTLDGKRWDVLARDIYASWDAPAASDALMRAVDPNDIQQREGEAPRRPNEAVLAFNDEDATAIALVRTHPFFAIIGTASAPHYSDWAWQPTRVDWHADGNLLPAREKLGVQMGGPWMKYLSNGVLLAAGRADATTPGNPKGRLTLFRVDVDNAILQRWGDFDGYSHYPGIVEHDGALWISCGKQQKMDPFEVYLLKVAMPEPA